MYASMYSDRQSGIEVPDVLPYLIRSPVHSNTRRAAPDRTTPP